MAESMATGDKSAPHKEILDVYSAWADGEWGMIMTGLITVLKTWSQSHEG